MITQAFSQSQLLEAAKSLPVTPRIMAQLHAMLMDSHSGINDIAALIGRDPSLSGRLLKIANSPAFGNGKVGDLHDALRRVGFGEVFRLVGVVTSRDLAGRPLRCYGCDAEHFGRHNLFSAIVAELAAARVGLASRSAYTAGLLRTVGMIVLDKLHAPSMSEADTYPKSGHERLADWEGQSFGVTHQQVNRLVLGDWNFPAEIVVAVGPRPDGDASPYAHLMDLVGSMARSAGHGLGVNRHGFGICHEQLERVRLTMDDAKDIIDQAKAALANFQS
ncbi:MAG: HDOD domain-containing protein [Verrucomicrobiota bacterium]